MIGNEIERRDWQTSSGGTSHQDEILPEMYAQAYHEAYTTIKSADPTAQVAIGGVIQATPLRLEYLDRIWDEYYRLYGQPIPVDWWNVHAFVLQEKQEDWGADIPAGIEVTEGILYTMNDNKDWNKAAELIRAFRQWMKERGQQNKPLIVSEYGVNMPWFSAEVVRDEFMYPSFDFFLNEKDPNLGYPADEYRLVQRWIWYSLDDDSGNFNGFLFYSGHFENPMGLAPLGQYWEMYVSNPISAPVYVDLSPVQVWYVPPSLFSSNGESVTATIYAQISNSGNVAVSAPFAVELWDEDSDQILGSKTISGLAGCGETGVITTVWTSMSAGTHNLSVRIDTGSAIFESNENNNQMPAVVLVATQRAFLPLVLRAALP
ncbi:MAG: CARDB domain-containing protein [Chloroflexota bacterium]|nr:CARDB domain-containing protein [Chloroflexota bacterium]